MLLKEVSSGHYSLLWLSLCRGIERFAYYGVRAFLVLYLCNGSGAMNIGDATMLYGLMIWIGGVIPFPAGLFGDLVSGNRFASIIGSCLQAIGYFLMCVPNKGVLILAIILSSVGAGLFGTNALSSLARSYQHKLKLLDSAMLVFYFALTLGAFMGPLIFGALSYYSWHIAFIVAGVTALIPAVILTLVKPELPIQLNDKDEREDKLKVKPAYRVMILSLIVAITPLYWAARAVGAESLLVVNPQLLGLSGNYAAFVSQAMGPCFVFLFCILLSVLWYKMEVPAFLKIAGAFFLQGLSLFLISDEFGISEGMLPLILICGVALESLVDLLFSPMVNVIVVRMVPIRFTTVFLGLFMSIGAVSNKYFMPKLTGGIPLSPAFLLPMTLFICFLILTIFYLVSRKGNQVSNTN